MSNHRTLLQDMKRGINCRLEAIAAIESLEAEVEEQARLLGASASREAELLARVEALEKDFAYHAELCTSQQARIATQQARIQAAIEVYAGMDGFIPETAAEGYCLRIIEQMNEALQESDDERV